MTFTVAHEILKEENSSRKATAHCEYAPHRIARTAHSKAQKDFLLHDILRTHSTTKHDNFWNYLEEDNETELLLEMLADAVVLERPSSQHKSVRLDGTLVDTIGGSMDHDGAGF
jgi:hypothetical protein